MDVQNKRETDLSETPDENRVFVIVAAYNEVRTIKSVLGPLIEAAYNVVVVDDASTDDSRAALCGLPVFYLRHAINLGQGAALQTGMSFALRQGADYIVHFDADGQHDPHDIPVLLMPLINGQADVVFGSRFMRPEDEKLVPPVKRLALYGGIRLNWILTGIKLTDAHNGFRALNRLAASRIYLKENRYAHASEILAQVKRHKLRYAERPTRIEYTDYSTSKGQSLWNAFNILFDVLIRRFIR